MLVPLVQPTSRYAPAPIVDLTDKDVRARMTNGALKAFFNIMDVWQIRDADARVLLGDVSNGSYYALKKGTDKPLDVDRLHRIAALIGIFKSLNILHDEALADVWITRPNSNRIIGGLTPLAFLKSGGLPAFETLRRLLDARRGGR